MRARYLVLAVIAALLGGFFHFWDTAPAALAQVYGGGGINSTGAITPGHCMTWVNPSTAQDAGLTCGGTGSPGGSNGQIQWNNTGAFAGFTMGGDCTLVASTGTITCTKSNGSAFGTAAFVNIGTSGGTVPLLNGNFTASGNITFSGAITASGLATGTQVSCLGLTSGNAIALSTGACGSGGGSGTVTTLTAGTNITFSSGATCTTTCTINASGSGGTPANPTATAGPAAVNGSASTYMRSDAAPAVQKGSNSQFGIVEADGVTLTCPSGVCSVASTVIAGTTQTVTAAQWGAASTFVVTTAAQTLTLPVSSTLSTNGGILIQTIGQSVTLTPNAADAINGGSTGASATLPSGPLVLATTDGAGNIRVSPTAAGSVSFANPTATAGPTAVNGSASTAMRSDAAPAIQKGSSSQFGIVEVDNSTIIAASGVISAGQNSLKTSISAVIDGGGSAITTGAGTIFVVVPYACTISSASLVADQSGSIVVDVWAVAFASGPPTVTNTITASALPTLSSAQQHQDATLTGWTKSIAANTTVGFHVNSASTVTRVTVALECDKS